jgi:hypothetical protein
MVHLVRPGPCTLSVAFARYHYCTELGVQGLRGGPIGEAACPYSPVGPMRPGLPLYSWQHTSKPIKIPNTVISTETYSKRLFHLSLTHNHGRINHRHNLCEVWWRSWVSLVHEEASTPSHGYLVRTEHRLREVWASCTSRHDARYLAIRLTSIWSPTKSRPRSVSDRRIPNQ